MRVRMGSRDASAAAGYDLERYRELGHHWLIRSTEIEYLRPLVYGDSVEISTWVVDFRRASSRRSYQFKLVGTGELPRLPLHGFAKCPFVFHVNMRPNFFLQRMDGSAVPSQPPVRARR